MRPVQLRAWLCLAGPLALLAAASGAAALADGQSDQPASGGPAANATTPAPDEDAADWSLEAALAKLESDEPTTGAGAAAAANSTQKSAKRSRQKFLGDCLRAHNKLRRLHKVPELVWDSKLAAFAAKRSKHMADSDGKEFGHPPGLPFGENLFWHSNARTPCELMVRGWYDEIKLYSFARPSFSTATGHFTQLVWRNTERLGCATAVSKGKRGGIFLTCNYDPPGNFLGEFTANVPPAATRSPANGPEPPAKPVAPAAPATPLPPNNVRGLGELAPANATSAGGTQAPAASTTKPKKKANKKKVNKKKRKPKQEKKKSNKKKRKEAQATPRKPKRTDSLAAANSTVAPVSSTEAPASAR